MRPHDARSTRPGTYPCWLGSFLLAFFLVGCSQQEAPVESSATPQAPLKAPGTTKKADAPTAKLQRGLD